MSEELEKNENVQTSETTKTESKGMSVASMVLGIISLVLCCIWYVSIPCAILAIIFSIIGKKKGGKGMATAGLILGIIALALLAVLFVLAMIGITAFGSMFGDAMNEALQNASYYY